MVESNKKLELQLPYKQGHELGRGAKITQDGASFTSSPFQSVAGQVEKGAVHKDQIKMFSLKTTSDFAMNVKANANFSYSGWGPTVQASFTADHNLTYKQDKALIINHRFIEHGFETFKGSNQDPPFSDQAIEILTKDPALFHRTFGDYYVSGFVHGSSYWLQCEVDSSDVSSDSNINLSGSVSGLGMLGGGSGGASNSKASTTSSRFTNVIRHLSGHDLKKLSGGPIDITTAAQDMINFQNQCSGVRIITHLKSFKSNTQYVILTQNRAEIMDKEDLKKKFNEQENDEIYKTLVTIGILETMNEQMFQNEVINFEAKVKNFKLLRQKKTQLQNLLLEETPSSDQALDIQLEIMSCENEMLTLFKKADSSKQVKMQEEMKKAQKTAIGDGLYLDSKYYIRHLDSQMFWGQLPKYGNILHLKGQKQSLGQHWIIKKTPSCKEGWFHLVWLGEQSQEEFFLASQGRGKYPVLQQSAASNDKTQTKFRYSQGMIFDEENYVLFVDDDVFFFVEQEEDEDEDEKRQNDTFEFIEA